SLELGERRYLESDRLGALETWRAAPEDAPDHERVEARIAEVEAEFVRLVEQYKQRARYFEERDRLAESILNYRLPPAPPPRDPPTPPPPPEPPPTPPPPHAAPPPDPP